MPKFSEEVLKFASNFFAFLYLGGYIFAIDRVGAAAPVIQLTYDDGNVEILNEDGQVLSKASLGQDASLMFPQTE